MAAEKARSRERFQDRRLALPEPMRARASQEIARGVLELQELFAGGARGSGIQKSTTVALFAPRTDRAEVDIRGLEPALRQGGLRTAYPRVAGPGLATWHLAGGAELVQGPWGLREPREGAPCIDPSQVALFVVPGVAFGRDGTRLGWGGGYYDRALAQSDALIVGVTFSAALIDTLPTEPHDRRMDVVVTEHETIRCASG